METEKRNEPALCSVIIPVYNQREFLRECVHSVCKQTWTNLEILLIDDGSTDGAQADLTEYQQMDSRIRIFFQKHEGVSAARNLGLRNAHGTWITFVDADDMLEEKAVERLIQEAGRHEAGIAAGSFLYLDEKESGNGPEDPRTGVEALDQKAFVSCQLACPCIVRTTVTGKIFSGKLIGDLLFRTDLSCSEDAWFLLEATLRAEKIVWVHEQMYVRRIHSGSAMYGGLSSSAYADSLTAQKQMMETIRNRYPELTGKALYTYIDICIWKRRKVLQYPDAQSGIQLKRMRKAVRSSLFPILCCADFSWKQKIWMALYSVGCLS